MITELELSAARTQASAFLNKAGIVLSAEESANIEVADFGLSELRETGLQLVTYFNTQRCCAKELVLFPRQTCPEHLHPPVGDDPGKEETFRCRWGSVHLFVPGKATERPGAIPPAGRNNHYTVWHEVTLFPGDQYTIEPNTRHWFQAGDKGAVVSEFSTRSRDETDIFEDPEIQRATEIGG